MANDSLIDYAGIRACQKTNDAYTVFRGINQAKSMVDNGSDTSIIDLAQENTTNEENSSAITVALQDFSEKFKSFHGKNSSNISQQDAKKWFFSKADNIFETEEGQEILSGGNVFQNDIFQQERAKNNGIQYAQDDADLIESALEFAKADIEAIEAPAKAAKGTDKNGKLEAGELSTYTEMSAPKSGSVIENLDLDGKEKTLSAEEYASYLLAADSISQVDENALKVTFGQNTPDGIITEQEAYLVEKCSDEQLKAVAQQYYDKYFKE